MTHLDTKLTPPVVDTLVLPVAVSRVVFEAKLDSLRVREKAHTREGDAIAAH